MIGEFLLAISSKGHGEGVVNDTSVDTSAIAIAADLIVKQPPHLQDELIEQMSKFLGQPDVLAINDHEAVDQLRKQVEALRGNPWIQAEGHCEKPLPAESTKAAFAQEQPAVPTWQRKLDAAAQAAPQMQSLA